MKKHTTFKPRRYPERAGLEIMNSLRILSHQPEISLDEHDRNIILEIESKLCHSKNLNMESYIRNGEKFELQHTEDKEVWGLEPIYQIHLKLSEFFVDYFLTEDGYRDLFETLKWDGKDSARNFLSKGSFPDVPIETVAEVEGRSRIYVIKKLAQDFQEREFRGVEGIRNPERIIVIRNPDDLIERLRLLLNLKKYVSNFIRNTQDDDAFSEALRIVLKVYLRRTNQLLAETYLAVTSFIKRAQESGIGKNKEQLKRIEKILGKKTYSIFSNDPGAYVFERFDKYINGVANVQKGKYTVISPAAEKQARKAGIVEGKHVRKSFVFKGISDEQLDEVVISAVHWQRWAKKVLKEYELLSEEDESTFTKDRSGPAKDGKWQVVIDPNRVTFEVLDTQRAIFVPAGLQRKIASVFPSGALPVLDHEIAHVLQHENKRKVGLAITQTVGMDRYSVYAEGGGVMWENEAQIKYFGHIRPVNSYYLRAIEAKRAGGSLKVVMKAFFDSYMQQYPNADKLEAAELSIDRVMRLFRNGGEYDDDSPHLTNSQPLVYLEQEILEEQLRKRHREELLLIGGVNLEMLAQLHRVGIIDVQQAGIPEQRPSEIIFDEVKELIEKAGKRKRNNVGKS